MSESHPFLATLSNQAQQEAHAPGYHSVDKNRNRDNTTTSYNSDSDSEQEITGPETDSSTSLSSLTSSSTPPNKRHRGLFGSRIQMLLAVASQLGLLIYFGTLAFVTVKAPWVYPYTWHPICMGLYGFIATEAILILQPIEKASQKKTARTVHGLLQTFALIFSLIGFITIYNNKERKKKVHFQSNHALYGCTAMFIFFLQVLFGVVVAYLPRRVFNWIGHARIVRIHRVAGYISIALLWITLWLAVLTNWMKRNFGNEWIFALAIGMLTVGLIGQVTPARLYLSSKRPALRNPSS